MSKQTKEGHLQPYEEQQLAECHGELLADLGHSVWDMLYGTATQYPNGEAIISV